MKIIDENTSVALFSANIPYGAKLYFNHGSQVKKGDIIAYFNGSNYIHTALYIGDGLIADCTSGRKQSVKYGVKSYSKWKIKIAIRYTGK